MNRFFVKTCGHHLKNLRFIFSAQQLSLVIMNYKNLSLVVNLRFKNWHCHRLQLGKPRIFQRIHHMVSPILNSESANFLTNIYYHFFLDWQTENKPCFGSKEICFLFQLLKLRTICGQNWENKLVKTSDEFVIYPDSLFKVCENIMWYFFF